MYDASHHSSRVALSIFCITCIWKLQKRLLKLPTGDLQCRVRGVNRKDTNSCVISYYQQGPGTIHDICLNDLLSVSSIVMKESKKSK